jgi:hypothetical protein
MEEQTHERVIKETINPMPHPSLLPPVYDIIHLPHDLGERHHIRYSFSFMPIFEGMAFELFILFLIYLYCI